MLRVHIADDVCIRREAIAVLLRTELDETEVTTGALDGAAEAVAQASPDLVLLDASAPDAWSALGQLLEANPATRVVALGVGDGDGEVAACLKAGFAWYVPASGSVEELQDAIDTARSDKLQVMTAVLRKYGGEAGGDPGGRGVQLTPRESEVAEMLAVGASNKEIARNLHISALTVKNHVHSLLNKLQVRRRGEVGVRMQEVRRARGAHAPTWARRCGRG